MNDNLFSLLHQRAQSAPDQVLVTSPSGHGYTYAQAFELSARLATRLRRLGMQPGERLVAQLPKSPEMLLLYLACLRVGGVYLPLNTAYTPDELAYFLEDAEPAVAIAPAEDSPPLIGLAEQAGATVRTLGRHCDGTLLEGLEEETPDDRVEPVGSDALAAILYTSGTTGRPKGAMLTHRNLASNAETLVSEWRFTDRDRLLHALPIFHTHGLFVACNVSMLAGASMLFVEKFDPQVLLEQMPKCTVMMGVPTFYTRLLKESAFNRETTAAIRLFISGSAPLLAETQQEVEARTGHAILERYGMTETNMITSNPYEGDRRPGTVGLPLPGVEVRVADERGAPLPAGEIGVLEVRGPNVFIGYWRMPEKTDEEFRSDGFFITGDLALEEPDGYIRIVGRDKDLVISGGYNVYPKEVEEVLDELPEVLESAVFGVPHPDFGEGVTAAIVPRTAGAIDTSAVLASLQDRVAKYKQPKHVVVLEQLPRNVMGKVQKNVLREQFNDLYQEGRTQ